MGRKQRRHRGLTMVQLDTLEHLVDSGFGRPFPRHGLQLLFWFANNCVNCEVIMKLSSDCQPEKGFCGFHWFENVEEILPVLTRPEKRKKKYAYFEIGNLNTETYPASANLPAYVRENYGLNGNYSDDNIDRIIIGFHMRTRVVEVLSVTEHDPAAFGRFRSDRTYEITCDLIRVLQNHQLDLTRFLTTMGYYEDVQMDQGVDYEDTEHIFRAMKEYSRFTAMTGQCVDFGFFSEAFNTEPFIYDWQVQHDFTQNNGPVVSYGQGQRKPRKSKAKKKARAVRQTYWQPSWEPHYYRDFNEDPEKSGGGGGRGGMGLIKLLLGVGALYLAARCFRWCLKSCWQKHLKMIQQKAPSDPPALFSMLEIILLISGSF